MMSHSRCDGGKTAGMGLLQVRRYNSRDLPISSPKVSIVMGGLLAERKEERF